MPSDRLRFSRWELLAGTTGAAMLAFTIAMLAAESTGPLMVVVAIHSASVLGSSVVYWRIRSPLPVFDRVTYFVTLASWGSLGLGFLLERWLDFAEYYFLGATMYYFLAATMLAGLCLFLFFLYLVFLDLMVHGRAHPHWLRVWLLANATIPYALMVVAARLEEVS